MVLLAIDVDVDRYFQARSMSFIADECEWRLMDVGACKTCASLLNKLGACLGHCY